MSGDFKEFLSASILGVVIGVVVTLVSAEVRYQRWEAKVIERGYGLYCPTDGEFAFVGECGLEETEGK